MEHVTNHFYAAIIVVAFLFLAHFTRVIVSKAIKCSRFGNSFMASYIPGLLAFYGVAVAGLFVAQWLFGSNT